LSSNADDNRVTAIDLLDHLMLSALWGASFLFMRIAAPEFGPLTLMGLRCAIGAVTLIVVLIAMGNIKRLKERCWTGMMIGVLNSAIPFVLFAYAALTIGSGLLSIINALAPFWGALIGWLWLRAPITRWQGVGLFIGFVGVALLVTTGASSVDTNGTQVVTAIGAAVLATAFYGFAANYAKQYLQNTDSMINAANSQIGAALVLFIPMLVWWPTESVSNLAWGAVIILGIFCTGLAYVLYFRLIAKIGASRAITVVFVLPLFAVVFGAVFLNETISLFMLAAGLVIFLGSALSLQLLPRQVRVAGG